jgi:hypothetical protein
MDARLSRYEVDGNGCWIWQGARTGSGYGAIQREPGSTSMVGAHVRAYEAEHGPMPEGLVVDHLCRVKMCVNPAHMEAVTMAENTRRGRSAKLTAADVQEIRRSTARGVDMAARYGVSKTTISEVRSRRYWRDVPA